MDGEKSNVTIFLDLNIDLRASELWSGIMNMFQSETKTLTKLSPKISDQEVILKKASRGQHRIGRWSYGRLDESFAREPVN